MYGGAEIRVDHRLTLERLGKRGRSSVSVWFYQGIQQPRNHFTKIFIFLRPIKLIQIRLSSGSKLQRGQLIKSY